MATHVPYNFPDPTLQTTSAWICAYDLCAAVFRRLLWCQASSRTGTLLDLCDWVYPPKCWTFSLWFVFSFWHHDTSPTLGNNRRIMTLVTQLRVGWRRGRGRPSLWRRYVHNAFHKLLTFVIFSIGNLSGVQLVYSLVRCVCMCACVWTAGRPVMRTPDGGWRKPSFNPWARILYPPPPLSHTHTQSQRHLYFLSTICTPPRLPTEIVCFLYTYHYPHSVHALLCCIF